MTCAVGRSRDGPAAAVSVVGRGVWPGLRRPGVLMLAMPVDVVPVGPELVFEPKWDGWLY